MSTYLGDFTEDYADLNHKFTTHDGAGDPTTLSGTPVVSVYKSNGTTESVAGVTLSADFDGKTGLNNVKIDLSADAFYAVGEDYSAVITTGTVDGNSVVGYTLFTFSIENRSVKAGDQMDLVNDAVDAASVATGAIDADAIATNAITATKIAASAIGASEIASNAITSSKIADNAIGADQIADSSIESGTFATGAITADAIGASAIGASEIASNAITSSKIAANAITSSELDTSAVTEINTAVLARLPAALVSGRMNSNVAAINDSADAAIRLAISAGLMIPGTVDNTAFTATQTIFESDDITEDEPDQFIGRNALWASGDLIGQMAVIEDYALTSGRGRFTISSLSSAPEDDDTFIVI